MAAPRPNGNGAPLTDDLDYLASSSLIKRKDLLDSEAAAQANPNRTYYFRKNADLDGLIAACTQKIAAAPDNARAYFIRGSSYVKQGATRIILPAITFQTCTCETSGPCKGPVPAWGLQPAKDRADSSPLHRRARS